MTYSDDIEAIKQTAADLAMAAALSNPSTEPETILTYATAAKNLALTAALLENPGLVGTALGA